MVSNSLGRVLNDSMSIPSVSPTYMDYGAQDKRSEYLVENASHSSNSTNDQEQNDEKDGQFWSYHHVPLMIEKQVFQGEDSKTESICSRSSSSHSKPSGDLGISSNMENSLSTIHPCNQSANLTSNERSESRSSGGDDSVSNKICFSHQAENGESLKPKGSGDALISQPAEKSRVVVPMEDSCDNSSASKRKNFLERNRQAAHKCRQRKKAWFASLEARVKYLESENETLQRTIVSLRSETMYLKSQLFQQSHQQQPVQRVMDLNSKDALPSSAIPRSMPTPSSWSNVHMSSSSGFNDYASQSSSPSSAASLPSLLHGSETVLPGRLSQHTPIGLAHHAMQPHGMYESRDMHRFAPIPTSNTFTPSYSPTSSSYTIPRGPA